MDRFFDPVKAHSSVLVFPGDADRSMSTFQEVPKSHIRSSYVGQHFFGFWIFPRRLLALKKLQLLADFLFPTH